MEASGFASGIYWVIRIVLLIFGERVEDGPGGRAYVWTLESAG